MSDNWMGNTYGQSCEYIGEYIGNPYIDSNFMAGMLNRYRENSIRIKRNGAWHTISVLLTCNRKKIIVG